MILRKEALVDYRLIIFDMEYKCTRLQNEDVTIREFGMRKITSKEKIGRDSISPR